MDRSDIEEMAKDLIPLAESTNAGETLMSTDYDDKWEFELGGITLLRVDTIRRIDYGIYVQISKTCSDS